MEETIICRMCLEPIYNFLCVNCLSKTISSWLSSEKNDLLKDYHDFHLNLLTTFLSEENQEKCIKCGELSKTVLCPYCYANEVFWWIFEKDSSLARKFAYLFNFDFLGTGYLPNLRTREIKQIILSEDNEALEMGICENCGNVSDSIKKDGGTWLCESCRDL